MVVFAIDLKTLSMSRVSANTLPQQLDRVTELLNAGDNSTHKLTVLKTRFVAESLVVEMHLPDVALRVNKFMGLIKVLSKY